MRDINVLVTFGSNAGDVLEILAQAGANAMLTCKASQAEYNWATHLLIPGGPDVDPAYYGQQERHVNSLNPERDRLESMLVDQALLDKKPLMGICRGHQMIAVIAGGQLYQDIAIETGRKHSGSHHLIESPKNAQLRGLIGGWTWVNSYHHQAVSKMPRGWRIGAVSMDGIIESIYHPALPVVSVQWHPELMVRSQMFGVKLFEFFLSL